MIMIDFIRDNDVLDKKYRIGFMLTFGCIALASGFECLAKIMDGTSNQYRYVHILIKVIEFSMAVAAPVICALTVHPKPLKKILYFPIIHFIFEIVSVFFGFVFYIDQSNVYHRSYGYFVYVISFIVAMLYFYETMIRVNHYYKKERYGALLLMMLFTISGVCAQFIFPEVRTTWLSIAIFTVIYYQYFNAIVLQSDGLTHLLSRLSFERKIAQAKRKQMILFYDVDRFKMVNDTYGHLFGDYCLKIIADELMHTYGRYGLCFRYGGDEFCALVRKNILHVDQMNDQFVKNLAKRREKEPRLPEVSIGYSLYVPGREPIDDVIKEADQMMYRNKKKRKAINKNNII